MKYRVTYSAAKRQLTYRPQVRNGQPTGTIELLDSRPTLNEEKTVIVEAASGEQAIKLATAHLPKDADISANVSEVRPKGASA